MTVERAFLARVYVDHCIKNKDEAIMEDVLPTVSDLAFRIQEEYNKLEESLVTEDEDEMTERSFIVGELMRLAVNISHNLVLIGADTCRGNDLATESTCSID
jgi:condensin complex subunit 3